MAVFGLSFLLLAAFFAYRSWLQGDERSFISYLRKWDLFLVGLILYCAYLVTKYAIDRAKGNKGDGSN